MMYGESYKLALLANGDAHFVIWQRRHRRRVLE